MSKSMYERVRTGISQMGMLERLFWLGVPTTLTVGGYKVEVEPAGKLVLIATLILIVAAAGFIRALHIEKETAALQKLKKDVWLMRDEGVPLRNEGNQTTDVPGWTPRFEDWHARVIVAAEALSPDLRHYLEPINKFKVKPELVAVNDVRHAMNVRVMSEILARIEERLPQIG
jgi:hypothetical protein